MPLRKRGCERFAVGLSDKSRINADAGHLNFNPKMAPATTILPRVPDLRIR